MTGEDIATEEVADIEVPGGGVELRHGPEVAGEVAAAAAAGGTEAEPGREAGHGGRGGGDQRVQRGEHQGAGRQQYWGQTVTAVAKTENPSKTLPHVKE